MSRPLPSSKSSPAKGPGRAQLLALATGVGLAAALLAYFGLARQTQGAGAPEARTMPVVVAARDLPARYPLTLALLRVQHLPESQVPARTVGAPEELVGQVTTTGLTAGQPVTRDLVTARSASPGMAWAVTPSRRAITVALDPVSGVVGFLEPGDHVDVLATFESGNGQAVTRTILQNARLLAIGSRTGTESPADGSPEEKPAASATLEVTPREGQALALAAARGKLQLALRGPGDSEQSPVADLPSEPTEALPAATGRDAGRAGQRRVVSSPDPPELGTVGASPDDRAPLPPKLPALPQIKVIRGTETTTVTVGE